MRSDALLLGFDLGSTNLKVVAYRQDGTLVAHAGVPYPTRRPGPLAVEQDPEDWWTAAREAVGALKRDRSLGRMPVAAIGVTGQMHGVVLLDAATRPVRPCLTWADQRGVSLLPWLAERADRQRVLEVTGNPPDAGASAAKLAWIREHEPSVWARAHSVAFPKDELRARMTGALATDPGDASGSGLADLAARDWSDELLDAWRLSRELLPPVMDPSDLAGSLAASAADWLGLGAGIPVAVGTGDTMAAAVGLGIEEGGAGPAMLGLGTAGQVLVATASPRFDPLGRLNAMCHARADRWCLMAAILDGGSALAWILAATGATGQETAALAEAEAVDAGAGGLLFLPQLSGERTPGMNPHARGAFVGLRTTHGRADLVRAVLEGVAYALREGLEILSEVVGRPSELRLGGGATRSSVWVGILADVLDCPIVIDRTPEASARGAAEIAARMIGTTLGRPDPSALAEVQPRSVHTSRYTDAYARYREARRALAPVHAGAAI